MTHSPVDRYARLRPEVPHALLALARLDADIAATLAELRAFEERLTPHEKGLCRVALSAAVAGQNVLVPMPAASAAETYCLRCRAQGKVEVPRG